MKASKETPLLSGNDRSGGSVVEIGWQHPDYRDPHLPATNLTESIIARRFGLSIVTARVVCEFAGIGGKA